VNGDADATRKRGVVSELVYNGAAALASVRYSADGGLTWTDWVEYSEFGELQLAEGDGEKTVVVQVADTEGTVYEAWDTIVLDTQGPAIALSGLANGTVLDVTAIVRFVYTATDASGATVTATLDSAAIASGATIDAGTLLAGAHTIVVQAVDAVGNVVTTTITFIVRASAGGIMSEVEEAIARGTIHHSLRNGLLAKLNAAQTNIDRVRNADAIRELEQFISQVQGNAGKKIDGGLAARLVGWAQDLIAKLR
jgi:hypothetical protein